MQKETINNFYIYIVLVITLIISIVGLARVVDTSLALLVDTSYRTSYSDFVMNLRNECVNTVDINQPIAIRGGLTAVETRPVMIPSYTRLTKAECKELETSSDTVAAKRLFEEQNATHRENEQRNKLAQLLRAIPWFVVPLPFFFFFNRMRKQK